MVPPGKPCSWIWATGSAPLVWAAVTTNTAAEQSQPAQPNPAHCGGVFVWAVPRFLLSLPLAAKSRLLSAFTLGTVQNQKQPLQHGFRKANMRKTILITGASSGI